MRCCGKLEEKCFQPKAKGCAMVKGCNKNRDVKDRKTCLQSVKQIPKDQLCVVQFMHSGKEMKVYTKGANANAKILGDGSLVVKGNDKEHCRRLIRNEGWYIDGKSGAYKKGNLAFWTEWEAPTRAMQTGIDKDFFKAKFVHMADFEAVTEGIGRCKSNCEYLNTDPCVFGRTFKYAVCHQTVNGDLRRLAKNSLIIFGSCKQNEKQNVFCLDTVFVIDKNAVDYTASIVNSLACSEMYKELTLRRVSGPYTFYRGVTCRGEVDMSKALFSFTPAQLCENGIVPVDRCVIDNIEILNKHLKNKVFKRGRMCNFKAEVSDECEVRRVWKEIVAQVIAKNFVLGVRFDWPKAKTENA